MGVVSSLRRIVPFAIVAFALCCGPSMAAGKIVLRTDYKINPNVCPFALALDRGYFRDLGLDVSIEQGQGSSTTIQTVAVGDDTFGLSDAITLIVGIASKSIPVKAVAAYSQDNIQTFAYHPDGGWDGRIESLRHKVFISSAGSAELSVLPAILGSVGMTMDDIDVQFVDPAARIPLFIKTPDSFTGVYASGDFLRIKGRMPDVASAPFARYGVTAYGTTLITKNSTIKTDPELVRKFVAASAKGWADAAKDPDAAVQATLKMFPDSDPKLLIEGLKLIVQTQMHTPTTKDKPIGWMASSDWTAMNEMLQKSAGLKKKDIENYFTDDFVTPN
jgi:NitT/TauT family transport system substrate-binding protein